MFSNQIALSQWPGVIEKGSHSMSGQELIFRPIVPLAALLPLIAAALLVSLWPVYKRMRGSFWRLLAVSTVALALLNPRLVLEDRRALNDIAVVLVDKTASQNIGARTGQTAEALAHLRGELGDQNRLDYRVVTVQGAEESLLFAGLDGALATIPQERLAGIIMISDGVIHDVPDRLDLQAPLHLLLSGEDKERDRRLRQISSAGYGIVGSEAEMVIRLEDPALPEGETVMARLIMENMRDPQMLSLPANRDYRLMLPVHRAGEILTEISVPAVAGEVSEVNNTTLLTVNGVRDRLRVLLLSGEPHPGERAWRNLLKSDPGVDLVHFTILRPPEKQDATPLRELALIPFPIRDLFEVKLPQFDLIIFDRYRLRGVLPGAYIERVADYVMAGGAVLLAAGPEFAEIYSLYKTALGRVLPARPLGAVIKQPLKPRLTDIGHRHPVTAPLPGARSEPPGWGRWHRQVAAEVERGHVLMQGVDDLPLLVLDRRGEGRVAQILSDQIWLWQRGYDGGGPQAELLRRVSHWLMGEPDLEEERLQTETLGNEVILRRYSVGSGAGVARMTGPSGQTVEQNLTQERPGIDIARFPISAPGLYRVETEDASGNVLSSLVAPGAGRFRELEELRSSAGKTGELATASGGTVRRISDGLPAIRRIGLPSPAHGSGWIGLRDNERYSVAGLTDIPLLPGFVLLLFGLGGLVLAWRYEGD